ncbi:MAG: ABC transporter ATP-binding protein [Thermoproteota archaeon]|nr:MAG: ABC transporter ATP-binding protein [Candidatus Korarchaeota archaeon]RLG55099.1 MAG: ABC transporter ATP-binding protein [Candidatus Korarchaeota archaeon]
MPLLELREVHVERGGVLVLRGVSISVEKGEAVALIGRNGAGKTTTMRAIMGLNKPKSGSISLEGRDITRLPPYKVAALGVGYVPEDRRIIPDLTAEENLEIAYGSPPPDDMLDYIYSIFPELKKVRKSRGLYLSGGEQRMLSIARALVKNPKLLLLDEPLEGLAPKAALSVSKALKEIASQGISMLISESGIIRRVEGIAERAYGLDRGEIVYEGTLRGILEDKHARERIWGL